MCEVFIKIGSLPDKSSCGPDGIWNFFLKQCVYTLSYPLQGIFNKSVELAIFPQQWKHSYIVPIFKLGDVTNYRGVCNQSAMAKLLDSLVHDQLHWQCKHIVGETQFGFSKGKSTTENLVLYESDLLESLERGYQVDSVYTNFSKAFDRVFKLLFAKLEALGFSLQVRRWFESFLVGRTQSVKINSYISRSLVVTSGVPQGSHCAPLLFNLFVSDIVDVVNHSKVLMFADDLKLYRRVV